MKVVKLIVVAASGLFVLASCCAKVEPQAELVPIPAVDVEPNNKPGK
jgi:PBP1b-binding outer membrane lipoprotein LpoB